jgi:hypothetical protein
MGGMSCTSITQIIHQPAAHPVTSPHFPAVAPSVVSTGDLTMVPPPPELTSTDSSAPGNIGAGGVSASSDVGWERYHPSAG